MLPLLLSGMVPLPKRTGTDLSWSDLKEDGKALLSRAGSWLNPQTSEPREDEPPVPTRAHAEVKASMCFPSASYAASAVKSVHNTLAHVHIESINKSDLI